MGIVLGPIAIALGFSCYTRNYFMKWLDWMISAGMYVVMVAILIKLLGSTIATAVQRRHECRRRTTVDRRVRFRSCSFHSAAVVRDSEARGDVRWRRERDGHRSAQARSGASSDDGLPIARLRPKRLLTTHQKRIELVRQCANESTEAEFERKWLSVLRRCASWFSSMPLTPELHREPGGAFRATIESTFYAMRLAGGQKFAADLTSDKRRRLEPQYNYAVFLAAACSSARRAVPAL